MLLIRRAIVLPLGAVAAHHLQAVLVLAAALAALIFQAVAALAVIVVFHPVEDLVATVDSQQAVDFR